MIEKPPSGGLAFLVLEGAMQAATGGRQLALFASWAACEPQQ